MSNIERRAFKATELRVEEGESPKIVGYAALFGALSEDLGGFRELIQQGAFRSAIETSDIRALVDHDPSRIVGRLKAGTLQVVEDERGLRVSIDPPNTSVGRDLVESLRRGDLDQMSFAFKLEEDNWERDKQGRSIRTLVKIRELLDVSIVTYPAYPDTSVAVRSLKNWQGKEADSGKDADSQQERRKRIVQLHELF